MKANPESSRRSFLKILGTATAAVTIGSNVFGAEKKVDVIAYLKRNYGISPNDQINIALIGAGSQGISDTNIAMQVPGVKLVAVCDLYDGGLAKAKKRWGADIFITKNYKEVLDRKDIDAVIVGTPDHWHQKVSLDAMLAGKHVYCENPMVYNMTDGISIIKAQQQTGKIFQVGSQGISSVGVGKAKELLESGAIGKLNFAEGFWAKRSPVDAWQSPIPADATAQSVDWESFISNTHKRPFDAERYFRWRNYTDYGTGIPGDIFVQLLSSLHYITGSYGPERIYSSGGLRFWDDGREMPDVLLAAFDYGKNTAHPAFNLSLHCNFADGTGGANYMRLVGSEGAMNVTWDKVILQRNKEFDNDDSFYTQSTKKIGDDNTEKRKILPPEVITYEAEKGYFGELYDHMHNFFAAIRTNGKVVEDATSGFRSTAPALLCNDSYNQKALMHWDPEKMLLKTV